MKQKVALKLTGESMRAKCGGWT